MAFLFSQSCAESPTPSSDDSDTGPDSTQLPDFSVFVSLGNSLTAGVQSGAVFQDFSDYSLGNLIAQQVDTPFEQPFFTTPGYGVFFGPGYIQLESVTPPIVSLATGARAFLNPDYAPPYNNLGLPGARVRDLLLARGGGIWSSILRDRGTAIQQALSLEPTFVIVWIGSNDVLEFAAWGGEREITEPAEFQRSYRSLLNLLRRTEATIVLANIPDITAIPFLTTLPTVVFDSTFSPIHFGGETVPLEGIVGDTARALTDADLLTLIAYFGVMEGDGRSPDFGGNGTPLPSFVVLDSAEANRVRLTVDAFNDAIEDLAVEYDHVLVDMHELFDRVSKEGITEDGVIYTAEFPLGGLFSLDAIHPSSLGYAVAANAFIEEINNRFGVDIPLIILSTIPNSIIFGPGIEGAGTSALLNLFRLFPPVP